MVDRSSDRVLAANNVFWLTRRYLATSQPERALAVAQMAAEVYSAAGLKTRGMVLESLGRPLEAREWYARIEERYEDRTELDRFYVRYGLLVGDGRFEDEVAAATKKLFPSGIERVALEELGNAPPPSGLRIINARESSGLEPGWIVVAYDGYRVRTGTQLACLRGMRNDPHAIVLAWTGDRYQERLLPGERLSRAPRFAFVGHPPLLGQHAPQGRPVDNWVFEATLDSGKRSEAARRALWQLGTPAVRGLVEALAKGGLDAREQAALRQALASLPRKQLREAVPYLEATSREGAAAARRAALWPLMSLAAQGEASVAPILAGCVEEDAEASLRAACATYLGQLGSKGAKAAAILRDASVKDPDERTRERAARALAAITRPAASTPELE
jgi:hypothetical protein